MIENFINSALIIDDSEGEITALKNFLEEKDIWVKHYKPDQLEGIDGPFKNRKIVFLDLFLVDQDTLVNNIARIRRYLRKFIGASFGSYGIVLWTKHVEGLEELQKRVAQDSAHYTAPLFIIGLDKTKYLGVNSFDTVLADLDNELNKSISSKFFIEWNLLVDKAKDTTISTVFAKVPDYRRQDQNLQFILYKIARNYTGIPIDLIPGHNLTKDTIKGFSDMLHYEIVNHATNDNFLFGAVSEFYYRHDLDDQNHCEYSSKNYLYGQLDKKLLKKNGTALTSAQLKAAPCKEEGELTEKMVMEICSGINSRLLIDMHNLNQDLVLPGNIYQIMGDSPVKLDVVDVPQNARNIVIEVTPPCDFAQSKKGNLSRIVGGFICDYSPDLHMKFKGEKYYTETWPLLIEGNQPKLVIFDFRYFGAIREVELRNVTRYALIMKAKDRLFADILQKLSSYTARLGLSVIH